MKKSPNLTAAALFGAAALAAMGIASSAGAATAPALQGSIALRTVTPQDLKDYQLTGLQLGSGLNTIGLGQPAYLEALINKAVPSANITNVSWTLSGAPAGSAATLGESPLGTNVPTYKMADRTAFQIAGRKLLRPDLAGQYTVAVQIDTSSSGSTNVTQVITAGSYMGIGTCALCHSGGSGAPNKVEPFSQTAHASFLARAIDGLESDHYGKNCISCHTVGYDVNTNAVNGGFDDVAAQLGWTFPAVLTNGNWAAMPKQLQNLGNIQCENCHGPGDQHAFSLGDPSKISVTYAAGDCAQCHDSKPNHSRSAEWNNSRHAAATRTPSGPNRSACVRCHTAGGFMGYLDNLGNSAGYTTNTVYESITCQTCHDPHDASNPHQLRVAADTVTLNNGITVTNAGAGALCMNCHQSRTGSVDGSIDKYPVGLPTWAGGSSFGPHDNPASDMLEGVNGYTYGKDIPSSAHRFAVKDTCVTCHMQTVATTNPGFTKAGGHSMNMTYNTIADGVTNTVEMVAVCTQCHGPIDSFDMVRADYNGDGVVEGVQTEVQHLLDKLNTLMPDTTYRADGNYVADGLVNSISVKTNWPAKFLKAAWNYQFVNNDHSKGVHNAAYAVGLLKASISDLTGDANEDGLPDAWQTQYFGSTSNPSAAPNATPAGDGVPNWLKYTLGLDPTVPGAVVPGGVVWANGKGLENPPIDPSATNAVQIFTAAEVAFTTEQGKTYQIQGASSLSGGWQNIGTPITGNGQPVSYVTPTRQNAQQFYRVVVQ